MDFIQSTSRQRRGGGKESDLPLEYQPIFQIRLIGALGRDPKLFGVVRDGLITHRHFDKISHKRVMAMVTKILSEHPDMTIPIPVSLVADCVYSAADAGELDAREEGAMLDVIAQAWSKQIIPGFMDEAYVRNFRAIQETRIVLESAKSTDVISAETIEDTRMRLEEISRSRSTSNLEEISSNLIFDDVQFEALLRTKVVKSQSELLRVGIPSVDRALWGGLPFGKVGMVCAYTGVGKTVFGINVGWSSAIDCYGTAFVTLEMPEYQIQQRIFSKITRTPIQWLTKGRPDGDGGAESVIREMMEKYREIRDQSDIIQGAMNRFHIVDLTTKRPATARDIETVCNQLEQKHGYAIRNIVVDWIDRVEPLPKMAEKKDAQTRHLLSSVAEDLEGITQRRNDRFVYALTQANDNGRTRVVRMQHTNESRAKNHPVSIFFGLGTTDQGRSNGIWTLNADKNRDGPTFCMDIYGNMDVMEFGDAPDPEESLSRR